ncbi:MAG: hypothetical protein ACKOBW_07270 [Planctomycetota bacterium]
MTRWADWEVRLERAGEWLNPILVKEARQSLKSNHFSYSFMLLLLAAVVWSFLGLFYWSSSGSLASSSTMLSGYFFMLLFPLFLIVPFAAYRSLAAEREDGTFELMSITNLNARQIILGKLASATLQIILYFSALAPCLAFTYLLRGIDIGMIAVLLCNTLAGSWLLAVFGLYVATATSQRHWQVLNSLALLLLLTFTLFAWFSYGMFLIRSSGMLNSESETFYIVEGIFITAGLSMAALCVERGASRITFASDNQATRVRWVFFSQFVLWMGWHAFFHWKQSYISGDLWLFMNGAASLYAAFIGAPMVGESSQLSARVRRQLPQSFLERMTLSWFIPGSGSGYFFVLSCLTGVVLFSWLLIALNWFRSVQVFTGGLATDNFVHLLVLGLVHWSYVAFYLGLARLAMWWLSRRTTPTPVLSTLITLLLVIAGIAAPLLTHMVIYDWNSFEYSWMQWTNFVWTITVARSVSYGDHLPALFTLIAMAFIVVFLNVLTTARELAQE